MRQGYFVAHTPTVLETRVSEGTCPAGSDAAREVIRRIQEQNSKPQPYFENTNTRKMKETGHTLKPAKTHANCVTCNKEIGPKFKYCDDCRKVRNKKGHCATCGCQIWKSEEGAECKQCISARAANTRNHCANPSCRVLISTSSTYCKRCANGLPSNKGCRTNGL